MFSHFPRYPHRLNADGSFDTICHLCFRTLGKAEKEEDLAALEQAHVCRKRDLARMEHLTGTCSDLLGPDLPM